MSHDLIRDQIERHANEILHDGRTVKKCWKKHMCLYVLKQNHELKDIFFTLKMYYLLE